MDLHLTELQMIIQQGLEQKNFIWLANLDIEGAFDAVPFSQLLSPLTGLGIPPPILRYIQKWLTERQFQVKLTTAKGRFLSSLQKIGQGLPQGGVLSPLLWDSYFSSITTRILEKKKKRSARLQEVQLKILIYADDVVLLLLHTDLTRVVEAADLLARDVNAVFHSLGLKLRKEKSCNILLSFLSFVGGLYRRNEKMSPPDASKRDAALNTFDNQISFEEMLPEGVIPPEIKNRLPFQYAFRTRILGLFLDGQMNYSLHVQNILERARVRHGILAKLTKCTWGLEAGILRTTTKPS